MIVLIPIATIGCGKTTTFQTLQLVFPHWAHVQNDNINKSSKLKLVDRSLLEFSQGKPVVMCDRNNHQFRERSQLFKSFHDLDSNYLSKDHTPITFVCCNFSTSVPSKEILKEITYSRVLNRGDNHQSIKTSSGQAEMIMDGFLSRLQPFNGSKYPDNRFDLVIDMTVSNTHQSSLSNAKLIAKELNKHYPDIVGHVPSDQEFQDAFDLALNYTPSHTKSFLNKKPRNDGPHDKNLASVSPEK